MDAQDPARSDNTESPQNAQSTPVVARGSVQGDDTVDSIDVGWQC